jgi:ABC-type multidrug transport system permease subunit
MDLHFILKLVRYMTPFFTYGTGYIDNPSATGDELCKYCLYKSGDEFLGTLGWTVNHRWRNFGILLCYLAFTVGVVMILVKVFRKQRR